MRNISLYKRKTEPSRKCFGGSPPVVLPMQNDTLPTGEGEIRTPLNAGRRRRRPLQCTILSVQTHYFLRRCRRGVEDVAPYKCYNIVSANPILVSRCDRRCRPSLDFFVHLCYIVCHVWIYTNKIFIYYRIGSDIIHGRGREYTGLIKFILDGRTC